jgi:AcrR family transcriptional regulator
MIEVVNDEERLDDRRERVFAALLDLFSEQGPGGTIEPEALRRRAGLDVAEFTQCFESVEAAVLALFDRYVADFRADAEAAYAGEEHWPDNLRAISYETARWIIDNPQEARFCAFAVFSAGELAAARQEEIFNTFRYAYDGALVELDDPEAVPEATAERAIGSLVHIITRRLRVDDLEWTYEIVPEMMYSAVLAYMGPEAAKRELEAPPPQWVRERQARLGSAPPPET